MQFEINVVPGARRVMLLGALCFSTGLFAQVPVVTQTNTSVRVMAANLSSGNFQRYESSGLNILKGLKPDVVAMQEFNCSNSFGINTTAAIRSTIDDTFGTNFSYFREANSGYAIPNGIISRYPMIASGSWVDSDSGVNDRGFAWARIDLPGTNDLYVVSIHLKASNTSSDISRRAAEAAELKALISTNFPANAWLIVAGDMNFYSETEGAMTNFASFLSDSPVPADLNGGTNTNLGRSQRYDRVLPSFSLTNSLVPVVLPSNTISNGLLFVSTNYVPLSDVPPVQFGDSVVSGMQHMGVVKDFNITYSVTNVVTVPPPQLVIDFSGVIRWQGMSNVAYTVQSKTNLAAANWFTLGTATSTTANFSFTNSITGALRLFYRVTFP
jgi:endonuclease/exonuclease/phosphatase family metal-dependent hydrolase